MTRIPVSAPFLGDEEQDRVADVLESGWVSPLGPAVEQFENLVCERVTTGHGIATDSGTAALHLALNALDIGPEDEVVIPDFTYGATGMAVIATGATPVLADIDRNTLGIDPVHAAEQVTEDTAAIIVAHLFGSPADMDPLLALADEHDLAVIEDAAESLGSAYNGKQVGSIGDVGCFSFAWNKTITTGKGGMLVTDDSDLAYRAHEIADGGREHGEQYRHIRPGHNYRMDSVRAAIGTAQMQRLDTINTRKQENSAVYRERLRDVLPHDQMTPDRDGLIPWLFYLLPERSDAVKQRLAARGIGFRDFFPPLHDMPVFPGTGTYPVTETVARHGIALPTGPHIDTSTVNRICDEIINVLQDT